MCSFELGCTPQYFNGLIHVSLSIEFSPDGNKISDFGFNTNSQLKILIEPFFTIKKHLKKYKAYCKYVIQIMLGFDFVINVFNC